MSRRGEPAMAVALAASLVVTAAHAASRSQIPAADFPSFAFQQHPGAALPLDSILRGPDGHPLRLGSLFGARPVVLDFDYDRCQTLCGVVLDQVTAALRALPLDPLRDYELIGVDIDPQATPQDAAAFARRHGAEHPGMIVLTGDETSVRRLAESAGFSYRRDDATGQFAHPAGIVIATPAGRISRYLPGVSWRPLDLRLALAEAAGETVAAPSERLLLLCYCYDPQTGQYDLAVGDLLKVVGALTLLALGSIVWFAAHRAG